MGVGGVGACTLLGPEGPGDPWRLFGGVGGAGFSQAFTDAGVAGGCGGSGRLLRTT